MAANEIPTGTAAVSGPNVVDARGLRCPMPVVALARAAANVELGTQLVLLSDDPAAATDVPAWCRLRGQEFLSAQPWAAGATSVGATTVVVTAVVTAYTVRIAAPPMNVP
jgi:tRNA 2-thiouridine synthesizing protein A